MTRLAVALLAVFVGSAVLLLSAGLGSASSGAAWFVVCLTSALVMVTVVQARSNGWASEALVPVVGSTIFGVTLNVIVTGFFA